jgi:hypothetical protein
MSTLGNGIQKTSARLTTIHVDRVTGEYWLCDATVQNGSDYANSDCIAHSSVPMAEGG